MAPDDLATELRRNKPLLPVLTRSDLIEEEERDGDIVKCLRNKTSQERAIQEQDVEQRARERLLQLGLSTRLLRAPVSISVSACRQQTHPAQGGQASQASTDAALLESGFDRLYEALLAMIAPTVAYRHRKPAEVLMHHLKEHVVADLDGRIIPEIQATRQALSQAREDLVDDEARIVALAWREVVPELPGLLAQHADADDGAALSGKISAWIQAAFERQLRQQLSDHDVSLAVSVGPDPDGRKDHRHGLPGDLPGCAGREQRHGQGNDPESFDAAGLYEAIRQAVESRLREMAVPVVEACRKTLDHVDDQLGTLQQRLESSRHQLLMIERDASRTDHRP